MKSVLIQSTEHADQYTDLTSGQKTSSENLSDITCDHLILWGSPSVSGLSTNAKTVILVEYKNNSLPAMTESKKIFFISCNTYIKRPEQPNTDTIIINPTSFTATSTPLKCNELLLLEGQFDLKRFLLKPDKLWVENSSFTKDKQSISQLKNFEIPIIAANFFTIGCDPIITQQLWKTSEAREQKQLIDYTWFSKPSIIPDLPTDHMPENLVSLLEKSKPNLKKFNKTELLWSIEKGLIHDGEYREAMDVSYARQRNQLKETPWSDLPTIIFMWLNFITSRFQTSFFMPTLLPIFSLFTLWSILSCEEENSLTVAHFISCLFSPRYIINAPISQAYAYINQIVIGSCLFWIKHIYNRLVNYKW